MSAAAGPVGKKHNAPRARRHNQLALQPRTLSRDRYTSGVHATHMGTAAFAPHRAKGAATLALPGSGTRPSERPAHLENQVRSNTPVLLSGSGIRLETRAPGLASKHSRIPLSQLTFAARRSSGESGIRTH